MRCFRESQVCTRWGKGQQAHQKGTLSLAPAPRSPARCVSSWDISLLTQVLAALPQRPPRGPQPVRCFMLAQNWTQSHVADKPYPLRLCTCFLSYFSGHLLLLRYNPLK